ncbi:MAG: SDR family NAD(P)-dependent oxidoreductase, partial [Candidatus Thiodiazotropha taylori]
MITGATDGIGLAAAKKLLGMGHHLLLHGRNPTKLSALEKELS